MRPKLACCIRLSIEIFVGFVFFLGVGVGARSEPIRGFAASGQFLIVPSQTEIKVSLLGKAYHSFQFRESIEEVHHNPKFPFLLVITGFKKNRSFENNLFLVDLLEKRILQVNRSDYNATNTFSEDLWSPCGTYAALLLDSMGPFHVVKTKEFVEYVMEKSKPFRVVGANENLGEDEGPGKVHFFRGWVSDDAFDFSAGCCGDGWEYRYHVNRDLWQTFGLIRMNRPISLERETEGRPRLRFPSRAD